MKNKKDLKIAVIIPCYNEEAAIADVIKDFNRVLPEASVYVFDNNSKDATAEIAKKAGAFVHTVKYQGKGNVVRRMFAEVEADVYIMVDGDATYDAPSAPKLIEALINNNLDMVVGSRIEQSKDNKNYRPGHRLGNKLLTGSVARIFGGNFTDMLSGYRAFSRRFVKSFSADSKGFEIETELTIHTLEMRLPYSEIPTPYSERPEGSESKLSTYKDGVKILLTIIKLCSTEKPRQFWGGIGCVLFLIACLILVPIVIEFFETNEVARFPSLILACAIGVGGFLSLTAGLIMSAIKKGRQELKHLQYLSQDNQK